MTAKIFYAIPFEQGGRLSFAFWRLICCLFFLLPFSALSQQEPEYDEISVYFDVQGIGGDEIPAAIRGQQVYLSVTDVFDFLKIRNIPTSRFDSVEGFIIKKEATFLVDAINNQIQYQDNLFDLKPNDFIQTESNLYLNIDYFGKVFGLYCRFSFRSLSVQMKTDLELPLVRQLRIEAMRKNIASLKGELIPDTIIQWDYPLFKLGMADWSIVTKQEQQRPNSEILNLAIGSMIAGGDANLVLNYTNNENFSLRQQYYQWRFVNNNSSALRQVRVGKIPRRSVSSITVPVVGLQLTNTPTTQRRSFGSYTLSDYTEPSWIVELYVNNRMIDFVKADASGFYSFDVPLMYGNTELNLRFYGPWGEERSREENISIPLNFLPKKEFEYSLQGGVLEDGHDGRFARVNLNYGVSRSFTFGGGVEYLSSQAFGGRIPFFNMSLRLASGLLFLGEYNHAVSSVGRLSYQGPYNLQLVFDYTRYVKGQIAINTSYIEERKVRLSLPIRNHKFSAYSRFTLHQVILPSNKLTMAEMLFSGNVFGVNTNLTTNAMFSGSFKPNVYSNISMALRLPSGFIVSPRAQYNYSQNELVSVRCGLEKVVFRKAFVQVSYEHNFTSQISTAEIGLRYNFSFGNTTVSARRNDNKTSFVQSARGSLMYDRRTNYLGTSNRSTVGKGGIIFLPFLDFNCNGSHDEGEPKAWGLNVRIKGYPTLNIERDTTIRVVNIQPYMKHFVQIDPNSFDNIGWKIRKQTLSIEVTPNQFKLVEVPVSVVGEVVGMVYRREGDSQKGIGRIIVGFYNSDSTRIARMLTEVDGYFSFLGLSPGSYTARIDSAQLRKLDMIASPAVLPFTINRTQEGDYVDGLELVLQSHEKDTSTSVMPVVEEKMLASENTDVKDRAACLVQVGEFKLKANAIAVQNQIGEALGCSPVIVFEGDNYRVLISGFEGSKDAGLLLPKLAALGYTDALIVLIDEYGEINKYELMNRGWFAVQLGAFAKQSNALALQARLAAIFDRTVVVELESGLYKVRFSYFNGRKEARRFLLKLLDQGVSELIIVPVERKSSF